MTFVVASDGVRLFAEAHGEGPPILLSCALNTTHENWRPQVEPLAAAGYRVLLWDYRGHGLSDAPDDPSAYHVDRVVDDLARVLDWAAPGEPAVLAGLSFGGLASLHLALREPKRARAASKPCSTRAQRSPCSRYRTVSARSVRIGSWRRRSCGLKSPRCCTVRWHDRR